MGPAVSAQFGSLSEHNSAGAARSGRFGSLSGDNAAERTGSVQLGPLGERHTRARSAFRANRRAEGTGGLR
jgi:hypothetical protein